MLALLSWRTRKTSGLPRRSAQRLRFACRGQASPPTGGRLRTWTSYFNRWR